MSIIASKPEEQKRELIKAGTHPAYMYRVIYLGTQTSNFEGKERQSQRIWIDFEFPNEVVEYEDKDTKEKKTFIRTIGAEYTLSLHEKGKLLPLIQGWLARNLSEDELQAFDICSLIGKEAFLSITHSKGNNGKEYANIASVSPVMQGYTMPDPVNLGEEIGKAEWYDKMNSLPEFLQDKIKASSEWSMMNEEIPIVIN